MLLSVVACTSVVACLHVFVSLKSIKMENLLPTSNSDILNDREGVAKMKNRIRKIIKENALTDCDGITNILRRRFSIYNKKKRKFIKKMVTEVLENPLDETENNSSNDQDVQFADDISDNSNDLTVDQQMSNFYSDQNDEFDKDNGINGNVANKSKDGYDCFEIVSDEETGKRKKSTGEDSQTEDHNGVNKRQRFDLITEYCTDSYKKESVTFKDVYGIQKVLNRIRDAMKCALWHNDFGSIPIKNILLCGPSGCGKSLLPRAIAGEYNFEFNEIDLSVLLENGYVNVVRKLNEKLTVFANQQRAAILFFDNLNLLAINESNNNNNNSQKSVAAKNISKTICQFIDYHRRHRRLLIIGSSSSAEVIDSSLLRSDRFSEIIYLSPPTFEERIAILKKGIEEKKLNVDVDLKLLAEKTPSFQFVDLMVLLDEAMIETCSRLFKDVADLDFQKLVIEHDDFKKPLKSLRDRVARLHNNIIAIPEITWDNIGSLKKIKDRIDSSIFAHIRDPERAERLIIQRPPGILFFGPPGCGKTMIAKAIANEGGLNFILVKGAEFFNKYVGESEKAVRQCFEKARLAAPAMIFFDEIDGLCAQRAESTNSAVSQRVVTQLLSEMDGVCERGIVYLLAATNRPDALDPALLRPGRFGEILYVGVPDAEARYEILLAITKNGPALDSDVDLKEISELEKCKNFTGADLQNLMDRAAELTFSKPDAVMVNKADILGAFDIIQRSVSDERIKYYEDMKAKFSL